MLPIHQLKPRFKPFLPTTPLYSESHHFNLFYPSLRLLSIPEIDLLFKMKYTAGINHLGSHMVCDFGLVKF